MASRDDADGSLAALEARLGHHFVRPALCTSALTHKSWLNENADPARSDNERLEFLGDAVLTLVVSDLLMRRFPERPEGELSKARAAIVSEPGLARAAEAVGIGAWMFLGRGEEQAGGRRKPSILANALEAIVAAVYLDGGFEAAYGAVERSLGALLREVDLAARLDYKSRLQERSQAQLQATPQYEVVAEMGPDHDKTFEVAITLGGKPYGQARGKSKKEAEQNAAAQALAQLESPTMTPPPPGPGARGEQSG